MPSHIPYNLYVNQVPVKPLPTTYIQDSAQSVKYVQKWKKFAQIISCSQRSIFPIYDIIDFLTWWHYYSQC
jgi:hypothetical protein